MKNQPCHFCDAPNKMINNEVDCDVCGLQCRFMILDSAPRIEDVHNKIAKALGEEELDHDS